MNLTSVLINYNAPYIKHNISNLTYKHETIPAVYILVFTFKKILIINAIQSIKREMSQLFSYTCYVHRCKIVKETYYIYICEFIHQRYNTTTLCPLIEGTVAEAKAPVTA